MNQRIYNFIRETWLLCCFNLPHLLLLGIGEYEPSVHRFGEVMAMVSNSLWFLRQGILMWSYQLPIWLKALIFSTSSIIIPFLSVALMAIVGGYFNAFILFTGIALWGLFIEKRKKAQWSTQLTIAELENDQMKYKWKFPKAKKQFSFKNEILTLTIVSTIGIGGIILLNLPMIIFELLDGGDLTALGFILIPVSIFTTIIFIINYYGHLSHTPLKWYQAAIFGLLPLISFPLLMVLSIITGVAGIVWVGLIGSYQVRIEDESK